MGKATRNPVVGDDVIVVAILPNRNYEGIFGTRSFSGYHEYRNWSHDNVPMMALAIARSDCGEFSIEIVDGPGIPPRGSGSVFVRIRECRDDVPIVVAYDSQTSMIDAIAEEIIEAHGYDVSENEIPVEEEEIFRVDLESGHISRLTGDGSWRNAAGVAEEIHDAAERRGIRRSR